MPTLNQAEPSDRAEQDNEGGGGQNPPIENAEEEHHSLEKSNTPPAEGFQEHLPPTPSDGRSHPSFHRLVLLGCLLIVFCTAHSEHQASRAHVQSEEAQLLSDGMFFFF